MRIIAEEHCNHCHGPVRVSLSVVPEPRTEFIFVCPHCNERATARFTAYVPEERGMAAVNGILMSERTSPA